MQHRNAEFGIVRRTFTCATLATLTTIGLFGLVAHLICQRGYRAPAFDRR